MGIEDSINTPPSADRSLKEQTWQAKLSQVKEYRDDQDKEVDPGIVETVAALNIHGIATSGSCEGHIDRAKPVPFVRLEAEGIPKERHLNERATISQILQKYGITEEQLRDEEHGKEWGEAIRAIEKNEFTPEFIAWQQRMQEQRDKAKSLLAEYYSQQEVTDPDVRLEIADHGTWGIGQLHNGGDDYERDIEDFRAEDRATLAVKLAKRGEEMKRFTEFLKTKYFQS